jgi:hypothetical protein
VPESAWRDVASLAIILERSAVHVFSRRTKQRSWRGEDEVYRWLTARERRRLAREMAREITDGAYAFSPARRTHVEQDGKQRELVGIRVRDLIVHTWLAGALQARIEARLPAELHSFRRGRSRFSAIAALRRFLRAHRRALAVRDRGLVVVRADVARYGESIATADGSVLWTMLDGVFPEPALQALLRAALRPAVDGAPLFGLPTGSPLVPPIENLYLADVDRALSAIAGVFYARFGDDVLIAHPLLAEAERARRILAEETRVLGLSLSEDKASVVFCNGAGRAAHGLAGAAAIDWLGSRISFDGRLGISAKKWRRLLQDLRARLQVTDAELQRAGLDVTTRAQTLAGVVRSYFDLSLSVGAREAVELVTSVDDRRQLRALDFAVALTIAERLAGVRGVRAFRTIPIRRLRKEGLPSLEHRKNA